MDWVKFPCTQCEEGLNCFRPHRYWKPILCLHHSVDNLTSYLREGKSPPFPATTTTTNATICPIPSPIQSSHSILLFILTAFIFLVFIAQAVQVGALLRRMVKNRIIQRKLQQRQKRMKTLRNQVGRQTMPMVVNFGRTGDGQMPGQVGGRQSSMPPSVVPVNLGSMPPYQGLQTQQREVIYDVPANGVPEDDDDADSF